MATDLLISVENNLFSVETPYRWGATTAPSAPQDPSDVTLAVKVQLGAPGPGAEPVKVDAAMRRRCDDAAAAAAAGIGGR